MGTFFYGAITRYRVVKKLHLAFLELSRLPRIDFFFAIDITVKVLSLIKFSRYLVNVKSVKIKHLNGHISYIVYKAMI